MLCGSPAISLSQVKSSKLDSKSTAPEMMELMPLEEVRPGMKGVGRTVFRGSQVEEFGVEVLGVVPGMPGPRQSAIIARLFGANVERTGVFAGMSGSPVFINNKLVGAIAFSFAFAKEPIAGITPIKQMIDIFESGRVDLRSENSSSRPVSITELINPSVKVDLPKPFVSPSGSMMAQIDNQSSYQANDRLNELLGQQLMPITTPLVFAGISDETLNTYGAQLRLNGLLPVAGSGGGGTLSPMARHDNQTLLPGSSICVMLARGDYSVAAFGTVTYRDDVRIYAFGHPFLSLGSADMAMAESSVVTVIPTIANSFKIGVPGNLVGNISQDRATGILGRLGKSPKMIPVRLSLKTSRGRIENYTYEVVNDRFLTPLLLNLTIFNTITSSERSIGDATISLKGKISVGAAGMIELSRRFSGGSSAGFAAASVAAPVNALLSSGFTAPEIDSIQLEISSEEDRSEARLERLSISKTEVARGETVEVQAYIRRDNGTMTAQRIPIVIPNDVPIGNLSLFIGDGLSLQQTSPINYFVPTNLADLVQQINKIKPADRLYLKLFRRAAGAVVGTNDMPNLPPSVVATLNSDRSTRGYLPTILSPIYENALPLTDYVVRGQQFLDIKVVR